MPKKGGIRRRVRREVADIEYGPEQLGAGSVFPFGAIDGDARKFQRCLFDPSRGKPNVAPWSIAELALIAAGLIGTALATYLAFKLFAL